MSDPIDEWHGRQSDIEPIQDRFYVEFNTMDYGMPCPLNQYWKPATKFKLGKSKKGRVSRDTLAGEIRALRKHAEPLIGQLHASITYQQSHRQTVVCDVDAYQKVILDAGQDAGLYKDDGQIVQLTIKRIPGKVSGGFCSFEVWEV